MVARLAIVLWQVNNPSSTTVAPFARVHRARAPVPRLCTLVKFLTRWQINAAFASICSIQPYRNLGLNFAQGLFVSIVSYPCGPRSEKVEEIIVIECNMGYFRN